jgi:MFS family permease
LPHISHRSLESAVNRQRAGYPYRRGTAGFRCTTLALLAAGVLAVLAPLASFVVLLVLRGLLGFALAGLQATAMSYLAEGCHHGSLRLAMGLYIAGNGIGGTLGRLLAGVVVDVTSWRVALGVIGLLSLVCAAVFRLSIVPSSGFTPALPRSRCWPARCWRRWPAASPSGSGAPACCRRPRAACSAGSRSW